MTVPLRPAELPVAPENTARYELFQAIESAGDKRGISGPAGVGEGSEAVLEVCVKEARKLAVNVGLAG